MSEHILSESQVAFDKFINSDLDFKERLVGDLRDFIEPIPDEEDYEESLAEIEGFNKDIIEKLILKIKDFTNDDIKLMYETLFSGKKFFNIFLITDPVRELTIYKKKAEVYEQGYKVTKQGYETAKEGLETTMGIILENMVSTGQVH